MDSEDQVKLIRAKAVLDAPIRHKDLDSFKRNINIKIYVVIGILGLVALGSIGFACLVAMSPVKTIAYDRKGQAMSFSATVENGTTEPRIKYFLSQFINNLNGVHPRLSESLSQAYNAMVPHTREAYLKQGFRADELEKWKDKNIESLFHIDKLMVSGKYTFGSEIDFIGYGTMTLRYVNQFAGLSPDEQSSTYLYFVGQIKVTRVDEDNIYGLLIKSFKAKIFLTQPELESYLLQQESALLEDREIFVDEKKEKKQ